MNVSDEILPISAEKKPKIQALLDREFGPGRHVRMAERLREKSSELENLGFMTVDGDNQLVAAISYWSIDIGGLEGALLGPLVVHGDRQGQGLGRALMQHSLALADQAGIAYILLIGDLPYYQICGFEPAPAGLVFPAPVDPNRVLIRWSGAPQLLAGQVEGKKKHQTGE
ncbi:MAG: GNAT family N-acetyltransferase [Parvibaculales bacterium]